MEPDRGYERAELLKAFRRPEDREQINREKARAGKEKVAARG